MAKYTYQEHVIFEGDNGIVMGTQETASGTMYLLQFEDGRDTLAFEDALTLPPAPEAHQAMPEPQDAAPQEVGDEVSPAASESPLSAPQSEV